MKLEVLQENINKALGVVGKAVAVHAQLPVLSNIMLFADRGRLKLSATNLETGINYRIGAKVEKEGSICVPGKVFQEFIASLPAEKVVIELKENNLKISCGSHEAEFVTLSSSEFPPIPSLSEKPQIEFDSKSFSEFVSQVAFSSAHDESRPVLTGIFFVLKDNSLQMAATDGYRLSLKKLSKPENIESIEAFSKGAIIPSSVLYEVARIAGTGEDRVGITFSKDSGQIIFNISEAELVTRLIDGQYPEYEKVLPEKGTTTVSLDKELLLRGAKIAAIFARESANIIRFEVNKNEVVMSANTSQVGSNISKIEAKIEGDGGKIAFNSKYLLDFLNSVKGERVNLEMSGPLNPGVFTVEGDSSYLHVIMPVRVQE